MLVMCNFKKVLPVGVVLFHADNTKLVSTFRNCFAKTLIQLDDEISARHVDNDCGSRGTILRSQRLTPDVSENIYFNIS